MAGQGSHSQRSQSTNLFPTRFLGKASWFDCDEGVSPRTLFTFQVIIPAIWLGLWWLHQQRWGLSIGSAFRRCFELKVATHGIVWMVNCGKSKPFFVVTPPVATFMLFGYGVALLNCRSLRSLLAAYSFLASCLLYWHFGVSNCLSRAHSFSSHIPKKPVTCKTSIATICHHHHQCHGTFHVWMQDCLKALWRTPGAYRM